MKTLFVAVAILTAACTTGDQAQRMSPVELCGAAPLAPGFSVAYGSNGTATLPSVQMQAISHFMGDYDTWANCILSLKDYGASATTP